jgi:hypothetical protein
MRDGLSFALGLAAQPAWLTWATGAGTIAALTACGRLWMTGRRDRAGCNCGTPQGGGRRG